MPLYDNALNLIRENLELLENDGRPKFQAIGYFTAEQFAEINAFRAKNELHLLEKNEILYMGRHHYNSRVVRDGYKISDLVLQIESALSELSKVIIAQRMTAVQSVTPRADGYGNTVFDRAVFELTSKKPRAELFSVIPKGDDNRPK